MLRYLALQAPQAAAQSVVQLRGCFSSFMLGGSRHFCLVLERLHGSLTDFVAEADPTAKGLPLADVRQIAFQLLVSCHPVPEEKRVDSGCSIRQPDVERLGWQDSNVGVHPLASAYSALGVNTASAKRDSLNPLLAACRMR